MRNQRPVLALLMGCSLAVSLPLSAPAQEGGGRPVLEEVNEKLLAWETQKARGLIEPVFDGKSAEHLVAMARVLEQEAKYSDAAKQLMEASEAAKSDPTPWLYLGEVQLRQRQEGPAQQSFKKAAELARSRIAANDEDGLAHYALGVAEQRLKNYDAAIKSLERARSLRGSDASVVYQLGATRAFQERWQEAVDLLTKALEMNSGIAYAYYYRGLSAAKLGRKDMLVDDLDHFIALASKAPESERARRLVQSAGR